MSAINTGKVVTGGLIAGLVMNVLDMINGMFIMAEDFRANAIRLGLDPAMAESAVGITTWVVIDFIFGVLAVWTYAAMRPRFGAGPKTAVNAAIALWLAVSLVMFGLTTGGLFPLALFVKITLISLVFTVVGTVAGAKFYSE